MSIPFDYNCLYQARNDALIAADFFNYKGGIENLRSQFSKLETAFKNSVSNIWNLYSGGPVNQKFNFFRTIIVNYYTHFSEQWSLRLSNRYLKIPQTNNLAEAAQKKELFEAEKQKLIDQATVELSRKVLVDLMVDRIICSKAAQNITLGSFFETLQGEKLLTQLQVFSISFTPSAKYQLLRQVIEKLVARAIKICPHLESELFECETDCRENLLSALLTSCATDQDLYKKVIESRKVDEFHENMENFNRWLFNFNFFDLLSSITNEEIPLKTKYKIINNSLGKIVKYINDRVVVDPFVKYMEMYRTTDKLNELFRHRFDREKVPAFELLPPSDSNAPLQFAKPSFMISKCGLDS